MSGIQRRRLLTATGVGLTGAIAGCLGSDDSGGENGAENEAENETEDDGDETVTEQVSGRIVVDNLDESSHTFDILVEYGGEIQHWETRSPGADETISFEHSWSSDREQFRVTARLNGGDPVNITPANWNESNCLSVFVRITDGQTMTHSTNTDAGHCDGATNDDSE